MNKPTRLFTGEFLSLCLITFLALCNIAVFYNLHNYLLSLQFGGREAGFLIGLYSFTAMLCYVFASRHITINNAAICMLSGVIIIACCGVSYSFTQTFFPLAMIRIVSGCGLFLTMSSSMVILVAIIPETKTGLAFSMYSVAMLLPYAAMPAISEYFLHYVASPPPIYMATALLLIPAASVTWIMIRKVEKRLTDTGYRTKQPKPSPLLRDNLLRPDILCILVVNCVYFMLFSSLFYLFKDYGARQGLENPGLFFTILMGVMVALRLFCSALFDAFPKVPLTTAALLVTGIAYGLLAIAVEPVHILALAILFGIGMGFCVPPLNALMYLTTPPEQRGYNANMMMLSIHFGTFSGPFAGAWLIESKGYTVLFATAGLLTLVAAVYLLAIEPGKNKCN